MPEADARLVADTLVQADLWGHQSHGVLRLCWYVARLRNGVMSPVTKPEFVVDAGAMAVIDGHDGVGQVIAARAAERGDPARQGARHRRGGGAQLEPLRHGMYYTLHGAARKAA